jgi:hypothetical protein
MLTHRSVSPQVSAGTVVRGTVLVAFVTLATTYTIAVLHHDAPLVPMISDTFVYAPESYVSRFGVVTASAMLQLVVWLLRSYLCAFASGHRAWRWFATVHSLCGAVASAAMGLVGAINDQENLKYHLSAATVFFYSVILWQVGYTAQLAAHPSATSFRSVALKVTCVVSASLALTAFFTLAGMDLMRYYTQIAACEWVLAAATGMSVFSLGFELDGGASGRGGGMGMELGGLWRGPAPGDEEEERCDEDYHPL